MECYRTRNTLQNGNRLCLLARHRHAKPEHDCGAARSALLARCRCTDAPQARRRAEGARGGNAASLGGIHDQSALQIVSGILRGDEIFRDAAHHFLRQFDTAISRLVPQLDDAEIEVLAQTRSARAFMLLGRVAGTFD